MHLFMNTNWDHQQKYNLYSRMVYKLFLYDELEHRLISSLIEGEMKIDRIKQNIYRRK